MTNTEALKVTQPADREIVLTRTFDAPRKVVFDALTRPDLLQRWFGPRDWSLAVCEVDLNVGSAWRFVLRGPDGADFGMRGVYREIVPGERLVNTEAYDVGDWADLVVTTDLVEENGRTTLTSTVLHPSKEIRDANSHMASGAAEAYDRLAQYLASRNSEPKETTMPEATTTTTTLTPYIACRNASDAITFYQKAFGADPVSVQRMPDGRVLHAALNVNGAVFSLMDEFPEHGGIGPQTLGGSPVTLHLQVPDCDAVFGRAVEAGCETRMPLQDMFWGDRYGLVADPFGHKWSIATPIRQVSADEMQRAISDMDASEA